MRCRLLVVLRLLIIAGLLLIVVIGNMSKANAKGSQLGKSQRGIGVGDGWKDRNVGKLQEWLIPLAMNDLLVVPHNLQALLHGIQALIRVPTHLKDASKHLQKAAVGTGGRRGTTAVGSARRRSSRTSMRSPWILGNCRMKRVMTHILVELLMRHSLNHELNVWSKTIGSERVGGYVPYHIHNILKDVEAHGLHECNQQVSLISRNGL
jgi:hypothetical protein